MPSGPFKLPRSKSAGEFGGQHRRPCCPPNSPAERACRSPRGIAWVWLTIIPALVVLAGIGLGLLLVSLHKLRVSRDDSPPEVPSRANGVAADPAKRLAMAPPPPSHALPSPAPPADVPSPITEPAPASQKPAATRAPTLDLLAGTWSGVTEADGVLTVMVTSTGRLAYRFSAGCQEHNQGHIRIRDQTIYYTEDGERRPVVWWGCVDGEGRLHLQMEDDDEIFVLRRVR